MICLKIRIKAEDRQYHEVHILDDDFMVAKSNTKLQGMVEKACKVSGIEAIEDVIVTARFEW